MAVLKYKNPNWDGTTESEEYLSLTVGSGGGTSFEDAPSDSNNYVRSNGSWVFDYSGYTYDGDYPLEKATINGVDYTFKTGDIVETTGKGLVIRLNNRWFSLNHTWNLTVSYTSNSTSGHEIKRIIDPVVVEAYFDYLVNTSNVNYTINYCTISRYFANTSTSTATASDELSKTETTTTRFTAYGYDDIARSWIFEKKIAVNYTRETTDDEFTETGTTTTYSGYTLESKSVTQTYKYANNAYSLSTSAMNTAYSARDTADNAYGLASTAYDLANENASDIRDIQNALSGISATSQTSTLSTSDSSYSISLANYSLIYLEANNTTFNLSYSYSTNSYINTYTVLIRNTSSSPMNFTLTGSSGDNKLGDIPTTIESTKVLELSFLRDKANNKFYIRAIS